jgi:hypothetical protein
MNCVAEGTQRGIVEGFAQGRVNVYLVPAISSRTEPASMDELPRQLRDMGPDGLDSNHTVIVPARNDADEPAVGSALRRQGAPVRREGKDAGDGIDPCGGSFAWEKPGGHDLGMGEAHRGDRRRPEVPTPVRR